MNKLSNNVNQICLLIIFLIATISFAGCKKNSTSETIKKQVAPLELKVIAVKGGYGYQIKEGSHILIDQPIIPAISEEKPFKSREDAQKVGEIVLQRIKNHTDFSVSISELRELNIE